MSNHKCIKCSKYREGRIFSKPVEIVNQNVGLKNINEHWNLNRKFEMSGFICDSCLEEAVKRQKSSDRAVGIAMLILAVLLLIILVILSITSSKDSGAAWILGVLTLFSGFGSYFFLRRYFTQSEVIREKKEAIRIVDDLKKDILKRRKDKRLCEICGDKGSFEIRIYSHTQFASPTMMDFPSLVFFRCRQHQPANREWDKEFQDLRAKSFKVSVSEI